MIFYEKETLYGLALASLPAIFSIYFFFFRDNRKAGLLLLLASAFLLRLVMVSLDPFLHEWDERFHALVAKHMMDRPFVPMLFAEHILPYDMRDWGYNHIWVHKQPLFLWQMALSMKIFGINTIALRLPSVVMGTILVWLVYDISRKWTQNEMVSFLAAFLAAFSGYSLELVSGFVSLEHNDLAFLFYMTCSYWAFTRYVDSGHQVRWAVLIGLFAGLAILNKWLTGFLIFGGWGLYLILSEYRTQLRYYLHIAYGLLVTCVVFVPWQLYIMKAFPAESAISYETNRKHITESLGHPGDVWFHFQFLPEAYHIVLIGLMVIGIASILNTDGQKRILSITYITMCVVLFGFFSIIVATKMPALVYPAAPFFFILMAYGAYAVIRFVFKHEIQVPVRRMWIFSLTVLFLGYCSFKPMKIAAERSPDNVFRNNKLINTAVYKSLEPEITKKYVIFNCEPYENIELMFFQDVIAYHWYPEPAKIDSLQQAGYHIAAFQFHDHPQVLPQWLVEDPEVLVLDKGLK